ncbi:MAG: phosphorylcholine transferase LicD [Butyrivibrio sp.]
MIKSDASIEDVQKKIFKVMLYVDRVCREHNIVYFLSGGTLLGAIRHNGFIPWDDDADIMLPRSEYDKLLKVLKDNPDDRFRFGSVETDKDWTRPWARVWDSTTLVEFDSIKDSAIGVYVDILPIDGIPTNRLLFKLHNYRIKFLNVLRNASMRENFLEGEKNKTLKKLLGKLTAKKGPYYYACKVNRVSGKMDYNTHAYSGVSVLSHYMDKERFETVWFSGTTEKDFCGHDFLIPEGYDNYLRQLYGDYMKLPPADKQKSDHVFRLIMDIKEQG